MDIFRKALRRTVHILGEKRLLSPLRTMVWLHTIELCRYPNLKNPSDINEKLMWQEHFGDTAIWTQLSDKYEVRKYVESKELKDILVPLYGIYDSFSDIDFSKLPSQFVIKATNGCGMTVIVKDKSSLDLSRLKHTIDSWQKTPFGLANGESHYLSIKPRIIIEKLLAPERQTLPCDYKFYCFNGKVDGCILTSERNIEKEKYKLNFIDPFTWTDIPDSVCPPELMEKDISRFRPSNINEMIEVAEQLSQGIPFVRVDLYNVDGKIYFGELTFTPSGCRKADMPRKKLKELGEKIRF
ncbi:MAG: hypothetical protein J1F16_04860 [Muribaculaceae bacterium]|nr:hypothetical protein [Muribaculaceae bacterium]